MTIIAIPGIIAVIAKACGKKIIHQQKGMDCSENRSSGIKFQIDPL
jgi:hypothetical protein